MKIDIALEPNASADEFARLGKLAEDYDLGTVWTANILSSRDPFLCFSVLARESHKIRMGPMAISPFEMHPIRMANLVFALNEISHGRTDIVVGGGGGTTIALKLKLDRRTMFPKMVRGVRECV
jgi:5,10-methylenetetrahydromethanopterin reductase